MITPAPHQKEWDAALIKQWRIFGDIWGVFETFTALTGTRAQERTDLLRMPKKGMPWKIGVRAFVALHLPKINERLCDQPPAKDVLLLRKLETSAYNTNNGPAKVYDPERRQAAAAGKAARAINELSVTKYSNRNGATDWHTVR